MFKDYRNCHVQCAVLLLMLLGANMNSLVADEVASTLSYVPADKGMDAAGVQVLFARGERKIYRGNELETIGMPCGGIGAGQLYVCGDGTLAQWWIDNTYYDTGYGHPGVANTRLGPYPIGYATQANRPPSPVEQGFAIRVTTPNRPAVVRLLNREGFDNIGFIGEYPIATILYESKTGETLPVEIRSEVFSPFIPLNTRDSANPATVVRYTVRNTSDQPIDVAIGGWLQNLIWLNREGTVDVQRRNRVLQREGLVGVSMDLVAPTDHPLPADDPQLGDVALVALDGTAVAVPEYTSLDDLFRGRSPDLREKQVALKERLCGAVVSGFRLDPRQSKTADFLVTWFFPNRRLEVPNQYPERQTNVGNMYAKWYGSAWDVAQYMQDYFARLDRDTHLFRDTYFDTTLPYWFVQRVNMPTSTLATETSQWWRNGRYWGWEGVGSCLGTCGHVYNGAQAAARLFPELERSVRLMQDLGPNAFDPATGRIDYRGGKSDTWKVGTDGWGYAADAQAGYVLKLYREHLMSPDDKFLDHVWPKVQKVMGYLIERDAAGEDSENRRADLSKADGVIEDAQHTTWDSNLYGPNGYVGTWYLAALRAAEEMARRKGDSVQAERYHALYTNGRRFMLEDLWNDEYFTHLPPKRYPAERMLTPSIEYGNGCLSNQLGGQTFASQLGLGELYPHEKIVATLGSIYRYNWTPDVAYDKNYPNVGPRHKEYPTTTLYALPGEAGLFECTWPHGDPPAIPVLHNAMVFTGTEYQVAALMLQEGLVQEGLTLVRGIHDRYDGVKRNPWNQIECGDHYARAMAAWGCLLGVSDFSYDGPAGTIGFAPRLTPDDFKCFFSAAEGWGSLVQRREAGKQINRIEVKWGRLRVGKIVLELPEGKKPTAVVVTVAGGVVPLEQRYDEKRLSVSLAAPSTISQGNCIQIETTYH